MPNLNAAALRAMGMRLAQCRGALGLTFEDVQIGAAISHSLLWRLEKGLAQITGPQLEELARLYRVSCGWILWGEMPYPTLALEA